MITCAPGYSIAYRGVMAVRVVVVEDDSFTRMSVVGALRNQGVEVLGEAADAASALEVVRSTHPDVALIDLDLGRGPTGIDIAHAMRRQRPDLGIVFLTSYEDPRLLSPSLKSPPLGARYLVKQSLSEISLLVAALESAAEQPNAPAEGAVESEFTDTQIEILRLVASGFSNAEIARIRVVEEKSVEQAISRTARKLGVGSSSAQNQRVELARAYYRLIGSRVISAHS